MLLAETQPALTEKEIPERNVYKVVWTFDVLAESQEEANQKIEDTMAEFTKMMGWPTPDPLVKLRSRARR
ncbi:MAG: hypothetical protein WAN17_12630 [Candidatus Sulfotelmatobacter sp.]